MDNVPFSMLGNSFFKIYLLGKEEKTMVECGVSGVIPVILKELIKADVRRILVMHAHFDHVCGLPLLKEIYPQAVVAASEKAASVLARNSVVERFFREDRAMTDTLSGPARDFIRPDKINIDEIVCDGDRLHIGKGQSLHIMSAPGHSPCSILAYFPEEETVFCSDSAGFPVDSKTSFPIYFDGFTDYIETIKKIMELSVNFLAGAHDEVVRGQKLVRDYLENSLDWAEKTREYVTRGLKEGIESETLAKKLFDQFYRDRLKIYTQDNILLCCRLIVKRSEEAI
ncbi:MAG: MBL fold metallo-hydrolase [Bacillota bacterium]